MVFDTVATALLSAWQTLQRDSAVAGLREGAARATYDGVVVVGGAGLYGLHLAKMLCNETNVYGFLRNWKGWVKYHYFNPEEPNAQQLQRDTAGEMPVIMRMLKVRSHHTLERSE